MATRTRTGRTQRRNSHTGRTRAPNLTRHYRFKLPPVTPGDFAFSLTLFPRNAKPISLDRIVVSFEWIDEEAVMTGNIQLRRPKPHEASSIPINKGDLIRCRVQWGGKPYTLWTMRAEEVQQTGEDGSASVDLLDDLSKLDATKRHWHFRARRQRRHGYFGHEVALAVARREGMKVAKLARCKHRNPKLSMYASGLKVIKAAYAYETKKTGRKFVIRIRNGKLEVVPFQRNSILYVLADQIRKALTQKHPYSPKPASVLTGIARLGKGKDAKKIRHTEYRAAVVRRIGKVQREKNYGHVTSRRELRALVRRDLAKMLRYELTATVQHQGIPFIRRGEGVKLDLAGEGFSGAKSFVYVTAVRHQVQVGSFTSEFDMTTVDPYLKDQQRLEKEARERARQRRKRRRGQHG